MKHITDSVSSFSQFLISKDTKGEMELFDRMFQKVKICSNNIDFLEKKQILMFSEINSSASEQAVPGARQHVWM